MNKLFMIITIIALLSANVWADKIAGGGTDTQTQMLSTTPESITVQQPPQTTMTYLYRKDGNWGTYDKILEIPPEGFTYSGSAALTENNKKLLKENNGKPSELVAFENNKITFKKPDGTLDVSVGTVTINSWNGPDKWGYNFEKGQPTFENKFASSQPDETGKYNFLDPKDLKPTKEYIEPLQGGGMIKKEKGTFTVYDQNQDVNAFNDADWYAWQGFLNGLRGNQLVQFAALAKEFNLKPTDSTHDFIATDKVLITSTPTGLELIKGEIDKTKGEVKAGSDYTKEKFTVINGKRQDHEIEITTYKDGKPTITTYKYGLSKTVVEYKDAEGKTKSGVFSQLGTVGGAEIVRDENGNTKYITRDGKETNPDSIVSTVKSNALREQNVDTKRTMNLEAQTNQKETQDKAFIASEKANYAVEKRNTAEKDSEKAQKAYEENPTPENFNAAQKASSAYEQAKKQAETATKDAEETKKQAETATNNAKKAEENYNAAIAKVDKAVEDTKTNLNNVASRKESLYANGQELGTRIYAQGATTELYSTGAVTTTSDGKTLEIAFGLDGKKHYVLTGKELKDDEVDALKENEQNKKAIEELEKTPAVKKSADDINSAAKNKWANEHAPEFEQWNLQTFVKYYERYAGLAGWSSLIWDKEATKRWQENVNKIMCDALGPAKFLPFSKECWQSAVCGKFADIKPSRNGILYNSRPGGAPQAVAHIEGYRSLPIEAPEKPTQWVYTITYSITNPTEKDMSYNVRFEGQRTTTWWRSNQLISSGGIASSIGSAALIKNSTTEYSRICLDFVPAITAFGGKRIGNICNDIVQAGTGGPSAPYPVAVPEANTTTQGVSSIQPSQVPPGYDV